LCPTERARRPIGISFPGLARSDRPGGQGVSTCSSRWNASAESEQAICERLEITRAERSGKYAGVNVYNHEWEIRAPCEEIGVIPAPEISELSNGLFSIAVEVNVNRRLFEYDQSLSSVRCSRNEVVGFFRREQIPFPLGVGSRSSEFSFIGWAQ